MNIQNLIFIGNAIFTIQNSETKKRFTFQVRQPSQDSPHFVKVLTGPNNEGDYEFLGTIFDNRNFRHGRKSRIDQNAQSSKVFKWALPHILANTLPEQIKIYHEGRCFKCGHRLTDPTSIEIGIGPICRDKMGI